MNVPRRPHPRVEHHVEELRKAGLDTVLFHEALSGIRDDTILTEEHRGALYRLVASESFLWYLEALQGAPVDRVEIMAEAARLSAESVAAIQRESAAIKSAPPDAATVVDRPVPKELAAKPGSAPGAKPRSKPGPKPRQAGPARKPKPRKKS